MKRRNDERIKKKLVVSFSDNGFAGLGMTSDLSKSGICVSVEQDFPAHSEILLSIAIPGDLFDLKGEVIWCSESGEKKTGIPDLMGIRLTEAPPEFINYVEYSRHNHD